MPANKYDAVYHDALYHDESDADDEYDRSNIASPTLPTGYESSPTESDGMSNQPTPTTFTHSTTTAVSPRGLISEWGADQVADFVRSLGLDQYRNKWMSEGISGEVLVRLQQGSLKDMSITSVGHRLTILKAVYEVKLKQNVPIEEDDYVPLSADANAPDARATQHDVARIIEQITLRDNRIRDLELNLKSMNEELNRIQDEQKKLREDTLPVIRMAKDKSHPLPMPEQMDSAAPSPNILPPQQQQQQQQQQSQQAQESNKLSQNRDNRRPSKMPWYNNTNSTKMPSPTIHDGANLDPSAAASAASNHLTESFNSDSRASPHMSSHPSPTSPYYSNNISNNNNQGQRQNHYSRTENLPTTGANQPWVHAGPPPLTTENMTRAGIDMTRGMGPRREDARPSPSTTGPSSANIQSPAEDPTGFMKSFRVSMEEPCHKVLPVALKKYNIHDDPSQYSLYIVHGDQERCLGLEERPLILFKQLANEGKKPMFMLRKHATPVEGFNYTKTDNTSTLRGQGSVSGPSGGGRVASYASYTSTNLPGGVL